MPKYKILSGGEVCKILARHGFYEERRKRGSHIRMRKKMPNTTISVTVPDHQEINIKTLDSIIAQSGILKIKFQV